MSLPKTEQTPDDPEKLPPARRRRAHRTLLPQKESPQETFIDTLGHRVSPTFDFFFFSLIAALVLSLGVWLDSPSLLVLGALLAPMMTPMVGLALGSVTGSMRFFTRSLVGLLIASGIVFCVSFIAGLAAWTLLPSPIEIIQAFYHARLSWASFVVVALGSVLTTLWMVRNRRSAAVASVALSYELFVPLTVAGFGLGAGLDHLWPDGLVVFVIYLACAALLSAVTLLILGIRPMTIFGYTLGGAMFLLGILVLIGLSGAGVAFGGQVALPTAIPSATPTPTMTLTPSLTPSITPTPLPPTASPTASTTPSVTPSITPSYTPSPTPVYAVVNAIEGGGAILRVEPGFGSDQVTSVLNGTIVQIIDEKPVEANNVFWLNVRIPDGREGWMLETTLLVATPAPNW
jgi:hypothetical protein